MCIGMLGKSAGSREWQLGRDIVVSSKKERNKSDTGR